MAWIADQWGVVTDDAQSNPAEIERRLRWWFGKNPAGQGILAVVEDQGELLATAGWCPKHLVAAGNSVLVAEIGHTMTAPLARGKGLFGTLVRFLEEVAAETGVQALYGTPNIASGRPYIERLGFQPLWKWRRWLKPLKGVSGLGSSLVATAASLKSDAVFMTPAASMEQLAALPSREWTEEPHILRSADYLTWRYGDRSYRPFAFLRDGVVVGWSIVGETIRRGSPAMSIAEFSLTDAESKSGSTLIRHLTSEAASASHVSAFTMTRPNSALDRSLLRAGFVARRSEWQLIAKPLAGDPAVDDLFGRLAFRAGDSDTV